MQGNVISNKTEPYDPKTVKLPREILQVLNTKLSIQDMLGIKQSQVKQILSQLAPSTAGAVPLAYVYKLQQTGEVAQGTTLDDYELILRSSTTTGDVQNAENRPKTGTLQEQRISRMLLDKRRAELAAPPHLRP